MRSKTLNDGWCNQRSVIARQAGVSAPPYRATTLPPTLQHAAKSIPVCDCLIAPKVCRPACWRWGLEITRWMERRASRVLPPAVAQGKLLAPSV